MKDEIMSLNIPESGTLVGHNQWKGSERREGVERRAPEERRRSASAILQEFSPEKYARARALIETELGKENMNSVTAALNRVAPSLIDNKLRLFFSYKLADQPTADRVTSMIQRFSGNALDIQIASKFQKGVDYAQKIRDAIERANWFLLLLPDPSVDWDWCLFETGMFRRGFIKGTHRIICLHHPDVDVPDQICEFNSVPATHEKVKAFLHELFIEENAVPGLDPLAPNVADQDLEDMTNEICNAIVPPGVMHKVSRYVVLEVTNACGIKSHVDLNNARILETDQRTCEIFGKELGVTTWGQLTSNIVKSDPSNQWLHELSEVIRKAACGDTFWPVQAAFEQPRGGNVFRPLLVAAQTPLVQRPDKDQARQFEIIFSEEVGSTGMLHVPVRLNALFTALRLAYRFRWEVIERFVFSELEEDDLLTLSDVIRRLEKEASSRGNIDVDLLCRNFQDPAVAREIKELFAEWSRIRKPDNSGELDLAIQDKEYTKIRRILSRLSEMNRRFIKLTTGTLEELSEKETKILS